MKKQDTHTPAHSRVLQRIPVKSDKISILLRGRGGSHSHLDYNSVLLFTRDQQICPHLFLLFAPLFPVTDHSSELPWQTEKANLITVCVYKELKRSKIQVLLSIQ